MKCGPASFFSKLVGISPHLIARSLSQLLTPWKLIAQQRESQSDARAKDLALFTVQGRSVQHPRKCAPGIVQCPGTMELCTTCRSHCKRGQPRAWYYCSKIGEAEGIVQPVVDLDGKERCLWYEQGALSCRTPFGDGRPQTLNPDWGGPPPVDPDP
jgi:hypothetical protein